MVGLGGTHMKKNPMPLRDFKSIARQISEGLDAETDPKARMSMILAFADVVREDLKAMTPAERAAFIEGFSQSMAAKATD